MSQDELNSELQTDALFLLSLLNESASRKALIPMFFIIIITSPHYAAVAGLFWRRNCRCPSVNITDQVLMELECEMFESRFSVCVCVKPKVYFTASFL